MEVEMGQRMTCFFLRGVGGVSKQRRSCRFWHKELWIKYVLVGKRAGIDLTLLMCCNHYHVLVRMSNELSDYFAFVRLSNELSDYCVLVRLSHELSDTGSLGSMELCADSDSGHGSSTSSTFDPQHHPPRSLGPASRHQSQSSLQHAPLSYQTPGKSPAPASFIHM